MIKPMLASPWDEKAFSKMSSLYVVEEKLDGVRCIIEKNGSDISIYSRSGKPIAPWLTVHIEEEIRSLGTKNVILDGELMAKDFTALMTCIKRKYPMGYSHMVDEVIYHVFDIPSYPSLPWYDRMKELDKIVPEVRFNCVQRVKSTVCHTRRELKEIYNDVLNKGGEGIIAKEFCHQYRIGKRSKDWLKLKKQESTTGTIVEVIEGTGKYVGMLGALLVSLDNYAIVSVGTGFTDENRVDFWERRDSLINIKIDINYMEMTENGSLRHPVFVCFRSDL